MVRAYAVRIPAHASKSRSSACTLDDSSSPLASEFASGARSIETGSSKCCPVLPSPIASNVIQCPVARPRSCVRERKNGSELGPKDWSSSVAAARELSLSPAEPEIFPPVQLQTHEYQRSACSLVI